MLDTRNKYFWSLSENGEKSGTYKALWAFRNSVIRGTDEFELSDFLWKHEVRDFVETLRKAGIRTFVVTDHSTGLMEMLHKLQDNGCRMDGLCTITRKETAYEDEDVINGIRFSLV